MSGWRHARDPPFQRTRLPQSGSRGGTREQGPVVPSGTRGTAATRGRARATTCCAKLWQAVCPAAW
eukprot:6740061-Alexandrium_andersonii.AAC.1